MKSNVRFDAVVVGSGINSMVAGALLAKSGWTVCVLERSDYLGGAVKTAEITRKGFLHDVFSGWHILFYGSEAYRLLGEDLAAEGLRYVNWDTPCASVLPDGRAAFLSRLGEVNASAFEHLAAGDGVAWLAALQDVARHGDIVGRMLGTELWSRAGLTLALRALRDMHAHGLVDFAGHALSTGREWLTDTFRSEEVRALWAPWVLHTGMGPDEATSGLMLQVMAMMLQETGMPIPVGGGSKLIEALAAIIIKHGGRCLTDVDVERVIVGEGAARGVLLADGRTVEAHHAVLCNVTPTQLYGRLLKDTPVPPSIAREASRFHYGRGDMQIHMALSRPPRWRDERLGRTPIVNITSGLDGVSRAVNEAERSLIPSEPTICLGQPVLLDPSRAPDGCWIFWMQLLEMPRDPVGDAAGRLDVTKDGWTPSLRESVADRAQALVAHHLVDLDEVLLARTTLSPADLGASNINLVGGDPYSGSCSIDQNLLFRGLADAPTHATVIKRLHQIGASTFPGPGLSGASGTIVAKALIKEHAGVMGAIRDALES